MTTVSVIIPTFNRARRVTRAISSVLYQNYRDFEIIVVDDGSSDATTSVLKQFNDRIKSLTHHRNMGVSAARNTGIRAASSPLIAFLDSDDYWLPKKLAVQTDFFHQHTDAVACQTEEYWIRHGRRVNPGKRHRKPSGDIFELSLGLCLVSPSAVMLKRSLIDEVGPFDESLPACEDYDLWLRISSKYPVHLIGEYLVVKDGGHGDQLSNSIMGLDRFRIRALEKLILKEGLQKEQQAAAFAELSRKCHIYGHGCLKRGKKREGEDYLGLPQRIFKRIQGAKVTGLGQKTEGNRSKLKAHGSKK